MLQITENEILEAYDAFELSESELIELYSEGYISENTMDQLIEMGVFDEFLYEQEELEEGKITRGLRAIGNANKNFGYNVNKYLTMAKAKRAIKNNNSEKAKLYREKVGKILLNKDRSNLNYLINQAKDAKNSNHKDAQLYYSNKIGPLVNRIKNKEKFIK